MGAVEENISDAVSYDLVNGRDRTQSSRRDCGFVGIFFVIPPLPVTLSKWLPDKPLALQRMVAALRPGGVLLVEEPDWVTIFETPESPALRRVMVAGMRYLESTCPIDT